MASALTNDDLRLDHRGKPVRPWTRGGPDADDDMAGQVAKRAAFVRRCALRWWFLLLYFGALSLVVVMLVLGMPPPGIAVLGLGFPLASGVVVWFVTKRRAAALVRLTLLSGGRCAQCGYGLAELTAESDGCTVCPECGSAWKLDPALRERLAAQPAFSAAPARAAAEGETASDRRDRAAVRMFLRGLLGNRQFAVVDDRGRLVDVVAPSVWLRKPARWEYVAARDRRVIAWRLALLGWPMRLIVLIAFVPFFVVAALPVLERTTPDVVLATPHLLLRVLFFGVFWPLMILLYIFRPQAGSGRPIRNVLLRRGYCPTCAGNLREAPEEPDGCRVCPHCLSAWRMAKKAERAEPQTAG